MTEFTISDFDQFEKLTSDYRINDVFYPVLPWGTLLGWTAEKHPLHPRYNEAIDPSVGEPVRGFLALFDSVKVRRQKFNLDEERIAQQERVKSLWSEIERNAFYGYLKNETGFQKALKLFNKKQTSKKQSRFQEPAAHLIFVGIVGYCIGIYILSKGKAFKKKSPSMKSVTSALAHVSSLIDLFDDGISLSNYHSQDKLHVLLKVLSNELIEHSKKGRKKWTGEASKYRDFIQFITRRMKNLFGVASPAMIRYIISVIGADLSEQTIAKYVKAI